MVIQKICSPSIKRSDWRRCVSVGTSLNGDMVRRFMHNPVPISRRFHHGGFVRSSSPMSGFALSSCHPSRCSIGSRANAFDLSSSSTPNPNCNIQQRQRRMVSSWLPEALQSGVSIWGASGYMLQTIHASTGLPYWACFAAISVSVRTLLFPCVLHAAHTAARFAQIAPDVQFQITLFQKDLAVYRAARASLRQIGFLMRTNMTTLSATYKLHKVNPLAVFASPLIQLPIFWYVSVDLRKIVNGLDPQLAQNLVESGIAWIPDLTDPDPWFGLPVLAGVLLYANMEVSLGRRSMAGEATSKADTSLLLKDIFQSLAVFMPCFTSQMPAGVQIYIVTSFCFTMLQSAALRTEAFRQWVGLPSMTKMPGDNNNKLGRFTSQMMELKMLEQKARELRGNGPVLGGKSVLMHGWEVSFAGKHRKSSIQGSNNSSSGIARKEPNVVPFVIQPFVSSRKGHPTKLSPSIVARMQGSFMHGVSAPIWQLEEQAQQEELQLKEEALLSSVAPTDNRDYLPHFSDDVMEKANRGESPRPIQFVDSMNRSHASRFNAAAGDAKIVNIPRKKKGSNTKKRPRR